MQNRPESPRLHKWGKRAMKLRYVGLGLVAIAVVAGILASGGALSGEVDRNTDIPITGDPSTSLLAVEPVDPDGLTPPNDETVTLFEITNNMDAEIDIVVSPLGDPHVGPRPGLKTWERHGQWPTQLGHRETDLIRGVAVCDGVSETTSRTFEFEVVATGSNVPIVVTVYAPVTVTCDAPTTSDAAGDNSTVSEDPESMGSVASVPPE